jgi:hypothetical protein
MTRTSGRHLHDVARGPCSMAVALRGCIANALQESIGEVWGAGP